MISLKKQKVEFICNFLKLKKKTNLFLLKSNQNYKIDILNGLNYHSDQLSCDNLIVKFIVLNFLNWFKIELGMLLRLAISSRVELQ